MLENDFVFVIPVSAYVQANSYGLEPVYYTDVNVGEQVLGQLQLKASTDFEIMEVYSTESYFKLFWPNRVEVGSQQEIQSGKDFSKYFKVEKSDKAKTIMSYIF